MTNPSYSLALQEETINEAARRTRKCRSIQRTMLFALSPCVLLIVIVMIVHPQGPLLKALLFWGMLLISPFFPILVWMIVEGGRMSTSYSQIADTFVASQGYALQSVSSSTIGSLLEITLSGAINGSVLQVPAALLSDLLKSVRAEDEVVLTTIQRRLIHELILKEWWDWNGTIRPGPGISEAERSALRPSAISALAVLGNRSSISVLERFARKTENSELRESALQSIAQIRERLRYGPEEMLRASRAPERPNTLLRAAPGDKPQSYDQEQLLRADDTVAELQNKTATLQTEEQATPLSNSVKN